jgi:hypothetical protein
MQLFGDYAQLLNSLCITLLRNGNVGIGTSSPGNELEIVASSGWADLELNGASTYGGNITFSELGTSRAYIHFDGAGNYLNIHAKTSGSELRFGTSGTDNRMIIDSSGKVGIGTTSPDYDLTIGSDERLHFSGSDDPGTPNNGEVVIYFDGEDLMAVDHNGVPIKIADF